MTRVRAVVSKYKSLAGWLASASAIRECTPDPVRPHKDRAMRPSAIGIIRASMLHRARERRRSPAEQKHLDDADLGDADLRRDDAVFDEAMHRQPMHLHGRRSYTQI
jgi:hypothetical protein